jgi:hypothetical protein
VRLRASRAGFHRETDLYPAIKAYLAAQGYEAKGEVCGCDIVATRGDEPPVVVELKRAFNLTLLLQGVDRLALTDRVYLAVPRAGRRTAGVSVYRRDVRALCRRLGLGLLTVARGRSGFDVEVVLDPLPYRPRRHSRRLARLMREHRRRTGDPTPGGITRTPIMTAYRQEAVRCALLVQAGGTATLRSLRQSGVVPNAPRILQRDYYGWFRRVGRATYGLTDRGAGDLARLASAGGLPGLHAPAGSPTSAPAGSPSSAPSGPLDDGQAPRARYAVASEKP